MVNVSPTDGVKYGFRLMGYTIAVLVGGAGIAALGAGMAQQGTGGGGLVIGGLLALFGAATVYAGLLGMGYKVIADAVEKGMLAATDPGIDGHHPPTGQPPVDRVDQQYQDDRYQQAPPAEEPYPPQEPPQGQYQQPPQDQPRQPPRDQPQQPPQDQPQQPPAGPRDQQQYQSHQPSDDPDQDDQRK